jgi:predicted nuclease of predicted toxin-antitoxin system
LSLRLLIDEDTQDARLVSMLRTEGHAVVTVNEAGLRGQADSVVLAHAAADQRVVLTFNCCDFLELHEASPAHSGIVTIYQGRDLRKNMTFAEIVTALANLTTSGWNLAEQFVVLNAWNY